MTWRGYSLAKLLHEMDLDGALLLGSHELRARRRRLLQDGEDGESAVEDHGKLGHDVQRGLRVLGRALRHLSREEGEVSYERGTPVQSSRSAAAGRRVASSAPVQTLSDSERPGNSLTGSKDFNLEAKARIWP